ADMAGPADSGPYVAEAEGARSHRGVGALDPGRSGLPGAKQRFGCFASHAGVISDPTRVPCRSVVTSWRCPEVHHHDLPAPRLDCPFLPLLGQSLEGFREVPGKTMPVQYYLCRKDMLRTCCTGGKCSIAVGSEIGGQCGAVVSA